MFTDIYGLKLRLIIIKKIFFFGSRVDQNNSDDILESAVVQHEIAHLNGLTFYDFQWNTSPTPDQW
jgi:peptide deformylase